MRSFSLQYFAFKNDNISKSLSIQQACDCSTTADCLDGGSMVDYVEMLMVMFIKIFFDYLKL